MGNLISPKDDDKKLAMRNIVLLGLVSMLIDMSTEMVYPIIPLFLVSLGSTPFIIGIIEGIAEGLSAIIKSISGYFGDKYKSKKPFAIVGYSGAIVYKVGLLISTSWVGVLVSKIIDRTGKGLRTAPRDALIAENGGKKLGSGFGLHKMLDMLGAGLGVLLAYIILLCNFDYKSVIIISVIPAVIGVLMLIFVREKKSTDTDIVEAKVDEKAKRNSGVSLRNIRLDKRIIFYMLIIFIFSIGNSSNSFLLLRAQDGGFSAHNVMLLYLIYNLVASLVSIPFGRLSDKIGRKKLVLSSYFLYALVYFGFAFITNKYMFILLFAMYGVYAGMISGAERAMLVELSPKEYKGTVLGLSGTMQGLGLIVSSFTAGALWDNFGSIYAFVFGATLALLAGILVCFIKTDVTEKVENS